MIGHSPHLVEQKLIKQGLTVPTANDREIAATKKIVKDQIITAITLGDIENGRFGLLTDDLVNIYAKGSNTHPEISDELISIINVYKTSTQNKHFPVPSKVTEGVTIVQGSDNKDMNPDTKSKKGNQQVKKEEDLLLQWGALDLELQSSGRCQTAPCTKFCGTRGGKRL